MNIQSSTINEFPTGQKVDLTNCDREPIHIPGSIQPHGVLIVLQEPMMTIVQVSTNTGAHLGLDPDELLTHSWDRLLSGPDIDHITQHVLTQPREATPHYLPAMQLGRNGGFFEGILHRFQGLLILELEAKINEAISIPLQLVASLKSTIAQLQGTASVQEFCQMAAEQVRRFTGFDRVMIYKFLEDEAGRIIAEDKRADLEPFLGLHYPASDIPKQARALYVRSWLRFKVDNEADSVPLTPLLNPITGAPLDMSYAVLRSMSPIHTQYLRNMGVQATMSLSIIKNGQLWGLIACHHYSPRYVPHEARMASEFLAHMLSLQMAAKEDAENYDYVTRLNSTHNALVTAMSNAEEFQDGLLQPELDFLHWIETGGVALCMDDEVHLLGQTPNKGQVLSLVEWLTQQVDQEIYATHHLGATYPNGASFQAVAAGLLAVRLARFRPYYILWFRPAAAQQVQWAGDPTKPVTVGEFGERLTPRKSFDLWIETVQGKARPWQPCEIEAARALRRSILEIILRKAEELAKLNAELERSNLELDSFAYIASHDLKEPLRGIHNYSYFLLEDYAEKLDSEGVDKLQTLIRLSQRMEALIDSLLYYSRLGRQDLALRETNLQQVLSDTLDLLRQRIEESTIEVRTPQPLPTLRVDQVRVGEIFSNLIINAIKYSDKDQKWVEVGVLGSAGVGERGSENLPFQHPYTPTPPLLTPPVFYVKDNGIGIVPDHHESIFRIFKRLHGREEYGGGVGAGLTIVKKIVERHGGKIWLQSTPGEGTTFYFTLTESPIDDERG